MIKVFIVLVAIGCGDLIQFVQDLFNLDFLKAMEKINIDFGLNLQAKRIITAKELEEIKRNCELRKKQKERLEKIINQKLIKACNHYIIYNKILNNIKNNITFINWENYVLTEIFLEDKLEKIDNYMNNLIKIKEDKI